MELARQDTCLVSSPTTSIDGLGRGAAEVVEHGCALGCFLKGLILSNSKLRFGLFIFIPVSKSNKSTTTKKNKQDYLVFSLTIT